MKVTPELMVKTPYELNKNTYEVPKVWAKKTIS